MRVVAARSAATAPLRTESGPIPLREVDDARLERTRTGLHEFDAVLGGGIVPGSLTLIGGPPGAGKSTLLLQIAAMLAAPVVYVCGEESAAQVKLRAQRLGVETDVLVFAETNLRSVLDHLEKLGPQALIVDSIQTVWLPESESYAGSVTQVRDCTQALMEFAKRTGCATFIVGHVTKEGTIAGPRLLEHLVDTVLYFEGEANGDYRIVRAYKNRFGSVDEIGVFRMHETGLEPVANPSELFLSDRENVSSGSAVTALLEGSRPVLIEVQALAAKAGFGTPQRVSTGYDGRRLALLLAVLDKRAGLPFAQLDVFVNVVGGLRVQEPAGDLAVAAALASSVFDHALPADAVFLGEVGLAGEVRPISQAERRIGEAEKMGMRTVYLAERSIPRGGPRARLEGRGIHMVGVRSVGDLFERLFR